MVCCIICASLQVSFHKEVLQQVIFASLLLKDICNYSQQRPILVPSSCCFPQTASRRTTMHESRLAYERVLLASDRREQRDTGAKKPYLLSKKTQYYFKMDLNQREQRDTGATEPYFLSKETNIQGSQTSLISRTATWYWCQYGICVKCTIFSGASKSLIESSFSGFWCIECIYNMRWHSCFQAQDGGDMIRSDSCTLHTLTIPQSRKHANFIHKSKLIHKFCFLSET